MIDTLEKDIINLKNQLHDNEIINDYKKYNQITDEIDEKEIELMNMMEKWEELQK